MKIVNSIETFYDIVQRWLAGLLTSFQINRVFILARKDSVIFNTLMKSISFNILCFYGSLIFSQYFMFPFTEFIIHHLLHQQNYISKDIFLKGYDLFWLFPMYMMNLINTMIWTRKIANHATYLLHKKNDTTTISTNNNKEAKSDNMLSSILDMIYKMLMLYIVIGKATVLSFVPYIGSISYFILMSWIWGFYSFDYVWTTQKLSLQSKIDIFERLWPFFGGFGAPCALAGTLLPKYPAAVISGIFFPILVLMAYDIESKKYIDTMLKRSMRFSRLPIFYTSDKMLNYALSVIKNMGIVKRQEKEHEE